MIEATGEVGWRSLLIEARVLLTNQPTNELCRAPVISRIGNQYVTPCSRLAPGSRPTSLPPSPLPIPSPPRKYSSRLVLSTTWTYLLVVIMSERGQSASDGTRHVLSYSLSASGYYTSITTILSGNSLRNLSLKQKLCVCVLSEVERPHSDISISL